MKKVLWLLLLFTVILHSCDNGSVVNSSLNDSPTNQVGLAAPSVKNIDGSWSYTIYLPMIGENNLNNFDRKGIGINDGLPQGWLSSDNKKLDAYVWNVTTVNTVMRLRWGHYRLNNNVITWANPLFDSSSVEIRFLNGDISVGMITPQTNLQAAINANAYESLVYSPLHFSGAASTPAAKITHYHWDFGDGQSANGLEVDYAYSAVGTYNLALTVSDNDGHSQTTSVQIKVYQPAFAQHMLVGGDYMIQASLSDNLDYITFYVNLSVTKGRHGRPFWWGTYDGAEGGWSFHDIKTLPLNDSWGFITLPFHGGEQFEFTYSDYYYSFDGQQAYDVNWEHVDNSKSRFLYKGHFGAWVSDGELKLIQ